MNIFALPAEIRLQIWSHATSHLSAISIDTPDVLTVPTLPWLSTPSLEVRFHPSPYSSPPTAGLIQLLRTARRVLLEVLGVALSATVVRAWGIDALLALRGKLGDGMLGRCVLHLDLFVWRVEILGERITRVGEGGMWDVCGRGDGARLVSDAKRDALVEFVRACRGLRTFRLTGDGVPLSGRVWGTWRVELSDLSGWLRPVIAAARGVEGVELVVLQGWDMWWSGNLARGQREWAKRVEEVSRVPRRK